MRMRTKFPRTTVPAPPSRSCGHLKTNLPLFSKKLQKQKKKLKKSALSVRVRDSFYNQKCPVLSKLSPKIQSAHNLFLVATSLPHQGCLPLTAFPANRSFPCDEPPTSVLSGLVESPKRTRSLVPCVSLNLVIPGFLALQTDSRLQPSTCHIVPSLHSLTV